MLNKMASLVIDNINSFKYCFTFHKDSGPYIVYGNQSPFMIRCSCFVVMKGICLSTDFQRTQPLYQNAESVSRTLKKLNQDSYC